MFHPARLKRAMVASCRLPLGIPSRSLLSTGHLRTDRDGPSETTHCALVANQAVALDFHAKQQCVVVAVGRGRDNAQAVAAGLALHPQLLASAAPESNKARLLRFGVAGGIQKSEHQHLAGASVLHDSWHQTIHLF